MATFGEHAAHEPEKVKASLMATGSAALAIGGICAVVLAILGLAAVLPIWMVTIATILVGIAFMLEGVALAGRQMQLLSRTGGTVEQTELAGGMTSEFLAGCAGLTLGIIAIFGVYPVVLTACAVIIFGSALVFGSRHRLTLSESAWSYRSDVTRAETPRVDIAGTSPAERPMQQLGALLSPVYGTHVMIGLTCMALGIVALAGVWPVVLTLVGLLTLGFALFLTGTSVATRFLYRLARL